MTILFDEIGKLDISNEQKGALVGYFIRNSKVRDETNGALAELKNDQVKSGLLKSFLPFALPQAPQASQLANLEMQLKIEQTKHNAEKLRLEIEQERTRRINIEQEREYKNVMQKTLNS